MKLFITSQIMNPYLAVDIEAYPDTQHPVCCNVVLTHWDDLSIVLFVISIVVMVYVTVFAIATILVSLGNI